MDSDHLVLMHLSDIHFKSLPSHLDLDKEVRIQLESSAKELVKVLHHVDGILVTGDIAFGGQEEEYAAAKQWLSKLAELVGCEKENVWLVPGNHDVDWQVIERSKVIKSAHTELGTVDVKKIDKALLEYLSDSDAQRLIFEPIKNFNSFSFKFGQTAMNHEKLIWEDDLELNDGSSLRIRGLNSTIVSDQNDPVKQKVLLSTYQMIFEDDPSRTYLTLCHHPPDWLRDMDDFEDCLNAHVAIQLFGHKHRHRIRRIDNSIRLSAGAVHPVRSDVDWEPTYNYIAMKVETHGDNRVLSVKVWSHVWQKALRSFKPLVVKADGKVYELFELSLKPWKKVHEESLLTGDGKKEEHSLTAKQSVGKFKVLGYQMEAKRKLTYRLYSLPFQEIMEIAVNLKLLGNDENADRIELYRRIFSRAEATNQLGQLWDSVNDHYPEGQRIANPFNIDKKE